MNKENEGSPRLTYDIVEAGRLLGLGRNASYDAAKSKQIPTVKIGRRILVPKAALERLLNEGGVE